MDGFVRDFIRASLVWLGVGVAIGIAMALWPGHALAFQPAHAHANFLGFVSMMIFGVAYHVIPRFVGRPLRHRRAATLHLWVANAGLALQVGGFVLRVFRQREGMALVAAGAILGAAGAALFIHNLWRTLGPAPRPAARPGLGALPQVGR